MFVFACFFRGRFFWSLDPPKVAFFPNETTRKLSRLSMSGLDPAMVRPLGGHVFRVFFLGMGCEPQKRSGFDVRLDF